LFTLSAEGDPRRNILTHCTCILGAAGGEFKQSKTPAKSPHSEV
jgi:hypothetical protein